MILLNATGMNWGKNSQIFRYDCCALKCVHKNTRSRWRKRDTVDKHNKYYFYLHCH